MPMAPPWPTGLGRMSEGPRPAMARAAVVVAVLHSLVDLRGNLVALLIIQRMDRFVPGSRLSCHVMV